MSLTDSLCLSKTFCVCHYNMCLSQTVCVCDRQTVSVTDSLCPPKTVCVCYIQSMSLTDSLFLTDNLCLSQTLCVKHSSWVFTAGNLTNYTWFLLKYVREIWVCLSTPLLAWPTLWTPPDNDNNENDDDSLAFPFVCGSRAHPPLSLRHAMDERGRWRWTTGI